MYGLYALIIYLFSLIFPISGGAPLGAFSRYMLEVFPAFIVLAAIGKKEQVNFYYLMLSVPSAGLPAAPIFNGSLGYLIVDLKSRSQRVSNKKAFALSRHLYHMLDELAQWAASLTIPPFGRELSHIGINLLAVAHQGEIKVQELLQQRLFLAKTPPRLILSWHRHTANMRLAIRKFLSH